MKTDEQDLQIAVMKQVEQLFLMRWPEYTVTLQDSKKRLTQSSVVYHTPNGGQRPKKTGRDLKKSGTKSGIADLIIPIPNKHYSQLWLELKTPKGRQLPNQRQWELICPKLKIKYIICRSAQSVIDEILTYMELT